MSGYRTYLIVGVILVLCVLFIVGIELLRQKAFIPTEIAGQLIAGLAGLFALAIWFLRLGIKNDTSKITKAVKELEEKINNK